MNNFIKEAQRRSVTKSVGLALNPIEWVRQLSSKKYRTLIREVDRVDAQMRQTILGLRPALRDQLHEARMAMKNHEYRKVFQYATALLNSVDGVFVENMGELDDIGRRVYNEFVDDRMSAEEKKQLEDDLFREPFREVSSDLKRELVIEAGISQWLKEKIPTARELEGNLFNKLFQNIKGKQQEAAREALTIAERTYDLITDAFKRLDEERRNIMEYVKTAREYHKYLILERRKLQKRYMDYFPASEPEKTPNVTPPTTPTPTPSPLPAAPSASPAVPSEAPLQTNIPLSTIPEIENKNPNNPGAATVAKLINQAKKALSHGDRGISIALLVKASEICDAYGDEQLSINLLKSASNLERMRGKPFDCIFLDDPVDFPKVYNGTG